VWWIRQSILQALAEQSRIVRLPLNKVGLTNRINKAFSQLEQEYEREPTPEELAEVLNMETEEVAASLSVGGRHVSMDQPLAEGEDNTLVDVMLNPNAVATDEALEHNESLKTEITRSLKTLTDRQQDVICFFFGIGVDHPMSLEDIGEKFNLTRERVRQIKDKAITKLRTNNRCRQLRGFLG
jgi:RNA polymerase primary sigma factor